tara:strand:- start:241 stop:615 length:375 start_codon:yes stop_codon:yes gene_type:complete
MRLLFVCVGNSCRSQIAEAIAKDLGHYASSAGTNPEQNVSKNAIEVLDEMGIDSSGLFPKSIDSIETNGFDKIISMGCGVECPNLPIDYDWGLEDPHGKDLRVFREVYEKIERKILSLDDDTDA